MIARKLSESCPNQRCTRNREFICEIQLADKTQIWYWAKAWQVGRSDANYIGIMFSYSPLASTSYFWCVNLFEVTFVWKQLPFDKEHRMSRSKWKLRINHAIEGSVGLSNEWMKCSTSQNSAVKSWTYCHFGFAWFRLLLFCTHISFQNSWMVNEKQNVVTLRVQRR